MSIGANIMDFWYDTPEFKNILERALYTMGVSRTGRRPLSPEMLNKIVASRFVKQVVRIPCVTIRMILRDLYQNDVEWTAPLMEWLHYRHGDPRKEQDAWGHMELLEILRVHANMNGFYIRNMKTKKGDHCLRNWYKWAKRRGYL